MHAKMPHGVEAIKKHLQEVDNVPLLVSLYTDATPSTVHQMVQVFQQYGEVILSVGSAYRQHNQHIFDASDVSVAVGMLPGTEIPLEVTELLAMFPTYSEVALTKADILLHFRLVGAGSVPLLQLPAAGHGSALGEPSAPLTLGPLGAEHEAAPSSPSNPMLAGGGEVNGEF